MSAHISRVFGDSWDSAEIRLEIIIKIYMKTFLSICIDKLLRSAGLHPLLPAATLLWKHLLLHKFQHNVFAREIDSNISWKAEISMDSLCTRLSSVRRASERFSVWFLSMSKFPAAFPVVRHSHSHSIGFNSSKNLIADCKLQVVACTLREFFIWGKIQFLIWGESIVSKCWSVWFWNHLRVRVWVLLPVDKSCVQLFNVLDRSFSVRNKFALHTLVGMNYVTVCLTAVNWSAHSKKSSNQS